MNKTDYTQNLLKNDPSLEGQDFQEGRWHPLGSCADPQHRTVASNELMFDIDAETWTSCHNLAEQLEDRLKDFHIPFLLFTSGNMLHYSVYFSHTSGLPDNQTYDAIVSDYFPFNREIGKKIFTIGELCELMRQIRIGIFKLLTDGLKVEGAQFDPAPTCSSRHMIRLEGCQSEKTGFFKSWLPDGLPAEQPKVKESDVLFPESLPLWEMPPEFFAVSYSRFVKPKKSYVLRSNGKPGTIGWIENLLLNPQADGRKRIIDLILAPYLVNIKGLNERDALRALWEWVQKANELRKELPLAEIEITGNRNKPRRAAITEYYLEEKIAYVKARGLKPLKFDSLPLWGLEYLQNPKVAVMSAA